MLPNVILDFNAPFAADVEREAWFDSSLGRIRAQAIKTDTIVGEVLVVRMFDNKDRPMSGLSVQFSDVPLAAGAVASDRDAIVLTPAETRFGPVLALCNGTPLCRLSLVLERDALQDEDDLDAELRLEAWRLLYAQRACPSDSMLFAPHDVAVSAHIRGCPLCQERLAATDREAWKSLLDLMKKDSAKVAPLRKAPGQIWSLKQDLAAWDEDGRYLRPPFVLLLERLPEDMAWRVAQICPETALLGPDDVLLPGEDGFVEPWCDYALTDAFLANYQGQISKELLTTVQKSIAAQSFAELPEDSLLTSVRRLEIACGSFFARKSLGILLPRIEWAQRVLDQLKTSSWKKPQKKTSSPFAILALSTPPKEQMALAAAGEDFLPVNLYELTNQGDVKLSQVSAAVEKFDFDGNPPHLKGSIVGATNLPVFLYAFAETRSGAIAAEYSNWVPEDNYFSFSFDTESLKDKEPKIHLMGIIHAES